MRDSNVLIPGGGAYAAMNLIKIFKKEGHRGKIIVTDSDPLSVGFTFADYSYVLPRAESDDFIDRGLEVIKKHNIQILLPTSGFDIIPYSKNKELLQHEGLIPVINDYSALQVCVDKYLFYERTKEFSPLPYTTLDHNAIKEFPVFVKPRHGKGSVGTYLCQRVTDLKYYMEKFNQEYIFQEYLPGQEYTIDVFSDLNGLALCAIPRIRIQTKSGVSTKGKIEMNQKIISLCIDLANMLKLKGPNCVQMKLDKQGSPKFLEINPRFGGGTIFAYLAGFNIYEYLARIVAGEKYVCPRINEITVLRYFEEIILRDQ